MKKPERPSWEALSLFPLARQIAAILYQHPAITGVALTGSAARLENEVHDLDIVILHSGIPACDGIASLNGSYSCLFFLDKEKALIEQARGTVPVDVISVNQIVLRDCEYLNSENPAARDENFLKRLFCEIPLRLLMPYSSKGGVYEYTRDQPPTALNVPSSIPVLYKDLAHMCNKKECKPTVSWEEAKRKRAIFGCHGY